MREARPPLLDIPPWHADDQPPLPSMAAANDDLPLLVTKLEEDARARQALQRMGYLRALGAYRRHKRHRDDTFDALDDDQLQPSMEFVRDWLKEQRRGIISRYRAAFLVSLFATLVAGLAFLGTLVFLAG